jgi:hypothetical protein
MSARRRCGSSCRQAHDERRARTSPRRNPRFRAHRVAHRERLSASQRLRARFQIKKTRFCMRGSHRLSKSVSNLGDIPQQSGSVFSLAAAPNRSKERAPEMRTYKRISLFPLPQSEAETKNLSRGRKRSEPGSQLQTPRAPVQKSSVHAPPVYDSSARTKRNCAKCRSTKFRSVIERVNGITFAMMVCENARCGAVLIGGPLPA